MGIINFIIVLVFNILWASSVGLNMYFDAYKWKVGRWLSVILWIFAAWGLVNLIYVFL